MATEQSSQARARTVERTTQTRPRPGQTQALDRKWLQRGHSSERWRGRAESGDWQSLPSTPKTECWAISGHVILDLGGLRPDVGDM